MYLNLLKQFLSLSLLISLVEAWPPKSLSSSLSDNFISTTKNSTTSTSDGNSQDKGSLSTKVCGLKASIQRPIAQQLLIDTFESDYYSISNKTEIDDGNVANETERFYEEIEIDIQTQLGPENVWPIDNDFFHGSLCLLIRDHPKCNYDFENQTDIFFEIQIQGKFKRKPKGPLYIGLEIPQGQEVQLSWPLKTFLNAAIAFIRSWGYKWVHFNFKKDNDTPQIISSPAFQAFDRIAITPDGEKPPKLGYAIPESEEISKNRKNFNFDHKICTESTYTMSFNHTYVDILKWKVSGIPVVNSFHFTFTDSFRLIMYEVDDENIDTDGHVQAISSLRIH